MTTTMDKHLAQAVRHSSTPACKNCGEPVMHVMADLGMQPIANNYRKPDDLFKMEPFFPLRALVCGHCLLVQAQEFESAENMFSADYAYFASYSESWLEHARRYVDEMTERFGLGRQSKVVEIASNDGYLLKWFLPKGIPVLGVEPTAGTAAAATRLGIPTEVRFFGCEAARELKQAGHSADLMPANNVAAHVPDINDFIGGFAILLKDRGVATFEFHHVMNLIRRNQFDTIYHEHYYYHSLHTFSKILEKHGLQCFDVEELTTHGGSLRVYAQRADHHPHSVSPRVADLLKRERDAGLLEVKTYEAFNRQVMRNKRNFLRFLIDAKQQGKSIAAYGAPAKGNTLLNYAGVRNDFIDYTVDRNPHKQNTFLPGTMIPILGPEKIGETRPDYVLILPWNLKDEIAQQMSEVRSWGGRFVVLIPEVEVF